MNCKDLRDQLPLLDATAMAQSVLEGAWTSRDLLQAHLDRIELCNSGLNAIVTLDADRAMQQALKADQALARGELWGALHGIPVTVKDAFLTRGLRTTVGDKRFEDFVPEEDAEAVTLLKNAGAIVLGKTNCAPLCMDVQTANHLFGRTSNPWNRERTSGGSSGGEAAAVAAGLSPLGIGSDTAGSIRIPASYCGIYGFKPTNGTVSRSGLIPPLPGKINIDNHLSTPGPLARSVRDLRLCHRLFTRAPKREPGEKSKKEMKIACTVVTPGMPLDDTVRDAVLQSIEIIKRAGISLDQTASPVNLPAALQTATDLLYFEFFPYEKNDFLRKTFWKTLFSGGTFRYYTSILETRMTLAAKLDRFLADYDCWLLPATPTTAPTHNPTQSPVSIVQGGGRVDIAYYPASLSYTSPFNLTGHPVVVIPLAKDDAGLPIALQMIGKRGNDEDLLHCAALLDEVLGESGKNQSYLHTEKK